VRQIEKPKRFYEFRRDSGLIAPNEIDGSHVRKMDSPEGVEHKAEKHVQQIEKPKRFYESRRDSSLVAVDEIDGSHDGKNGQPRRG